MSICDNVDETLWEFNSCVYKSASGKTGFTTGSFA